MTARFASRTAFASALFLVAGSSLAKSYTYLDFFPPWVPSWLLVNAAMPFVAAVAAKFRKGSAIANFFGFALVAFVCTVVGLLIVTNKSAIPAFAFSGIGYVLIFLLFLGENTRPRQDQPPSVSASPELGANANIPEGRDLGKTNAS